MKRKEPFLDYRNISFRRSTNLHFCQRVELSHDFSQNLPIVMDDVMDNAQDFLHY